ncbi:hypothetical protein L596_015304 [Steinernema carpocapsae]|uniref:Uncharacterized protein n=1 Tax=Steinernema carpocapsae TaxID=34508 RepID=A0A4U5NFH0_STECR|nr:hypothetical protein L596_015304 [Steinernema carpocapsae]
MKLLFSVECAKIQVTESNFFSIYFSTLWEAIKAKLQEVKTYLETEIPKLLQKLELEIPKFVQTVETEVPKFVENLHLKEEFEEKTEAIVNATGKVKRYLGDLWETEFTSTVSNLRDVFLIILVLTVIALCAYLYLECFLFRKLFQLLSVIPRILFKGLRTVFRRVSKMRLKENYVHVYKDGKVYVNIV